jgi:hypothetical protein
MFLKHCNNFPLAPVITGITLALIFHVHCISVNCILIRSPSLFKQFLPVSTPIETSISKHVNFLWVMCYYQHQHHHVMPCYVVPVPEAVNLTTPHSLFIAPECPSPMSFMNIILLFPPPAVPRLCVEMSC